jgi:RNA polymerase sigma factor (sigma-70 family)
MLPAEHFARTRNDKGGGRHLLDVSHLTSEAVSQSVRVPGNGRLAEFESLYRAQVAAVTGFFARRSRDPQTVADLTADTFVAAMTSFASSPPNAGSERPWLFAIARRVYAKHCERRARRDDATRREAGRRALDEDELTELTERIDAEQRGRELLERLAGLTAVERQAVELVDLTGMTPAEAALTLDVSAGALRVRLFRARAKLRKEHR